jgi:arsenate reductase (thioredoxin)
MAFDQAARRRLRQLTAALAAEYDGVFSTETVEHVVADSVARFGEITATTYLPLFAERFARQRLRAVAQAEGRLPKPHPTVLFVCTHNAGRSQMAAAITRHVSEGRIEALSAGSDPASVIESAVIEAIAELGIEMAFEFPSRSLTMSCVPSTWW